MTDHHRCWSCQFWKSDEQAPKKDHEGYTPGLYNLAVTDPETYETVVPQPFEIRYCRSPKLRMYERPEADGAATMDGSNYASCLVTGPDFGCIHHTPSEG